MNTYEKAKAAAEKLRAAYNTATEELTNILKEHGGFIDTRATEDRPILYAMVDTNNEVRINVPYYEFNVRGKVSEVHREVHGVMPMTYLGKHHDEVVKEGETTTFFYGNRSANKIGTYLPFLSECDVYFISESKEENGVLVISLKNGPSWRMYL